MSRCEVDVRIWNYVQIRASTSHLEDAMPRTSFRLRVIIRRASLGFEQPCDALIGDVGGDYTKCQWRTIGAVWLHADRVCGGDNQKILKSRGKLPAMREIGAEHSWVALQVKDGGRHALYVNAHAGCTLVAIQSRFEGKCMRRLSAPCHLKLLSQQPSSRQRPSV